MSDYDKEQESELVKQHKRMAMGVPLDGQTLKGVQGETKSESKPQGGLSQTKDKE